MRILERTRKPLLILRNLFDDRGADQVLMEEKEVKFADISVSSATGFLPSILYDKDRRPSFPIYHGRVSAKTGYGVHEAMVKMYELARHMQYCTPSPSTAPSPTQNEQSLLVGGIGRNPTADANQHEINGDSDDNSDDDNDPFDVFASFNGVYDQFYDDEDGFEMKVFRGKEAADRRRKTKFIARQTCDLSRNCNRRTCGYW